MERNSCVCFCSLVVLQTFSTALRSDLCLSGQTVVTVHTEPLAGSCNCCCQFACLCLCVCVLLGGSTGPDGFSCWWEHRETYRTLSSSSSSTYVTKLMETTGYKMCIIKVCNSVLFLRHQIVSVCLHVVTEMCRTELPGPNRLMWFPSFIWKPLVFFTHVKKTHPSVERLWKPG